MLSWFRRQRLVAALMVVANPALLGAWVSAYHPCPVQDAVVVAAQQAPAGHEGHGAMVGMAMGGTPASSDHGPAHQHSDGSGHCTCIGQCLTAGIALPALDQDATRLAVVVSDHVAPSLQHRAVLPASRPLELLPHSTAPPQA